MDPGSSGPGWSSPPISWGGLPTIRKNTLSTTIIPWEWIVVDFLKKKNAGKENTLKLLMFFLKLRCCLSSQFRGENLDPGHKFCTALFKKNVCKKVQPLTVDEASIQRVEFSNHRSTEPSTWSFGSNVQTLPMHRPITRWALFSYKWGYNPYKWPYKWVTEVITLLIGVITPFRTGRGPPCRV